MDGHFVPNLTIGPVVVEALRPHSALPFDVHLMISPADPYVPAFAKAGADIITVHPEAGPHLHRTVQLIKSLGKKAGVSLNPATPPSALDGVLAGYRSDPRDDGQSRLRRPEVHRRTARQDRGLRQRIDALTAGNGRTIDLEVDGGINEETARQAVGAGADVLVAGTGQFRRRERCLCRQHSAIATGGRVSAMARSAAGPTASPRAGADRARLACGSAPTREHAVEPGLV